MLAGTHTTFTGSSSTRSVVHRFGPHGLYLLDEPEAVISIHGQLQLLVRIHDLVVVGCQFVVATHSPLLMAYPDATIYQFNEHGIAPVEWHEVDTVPITADFLNCPVGFLHELLDNDPKTRSRAT